MKKYARHIPRVLLCGIYFFIWALPCSFAEAPSSEAVTIVIVQPRNVSAYQEAVEGFFQYLRQQLTQRFNAIIYENPEGLYNTLEQMSQEPKPPEIKVIVTVGSQATADVARTIQNIPIVFSMVLEPERILNKQDNVVGASLNIPFKLQLEMIKNVLPTVKTVGIIYDPQRNGASVKKNIDQAEQFGLHIKTFAVSSPKGIPAALTRVNEETDVLLGIVDSTVYTSRTTEFIIRYTIKKQLPFIGISSSYVKAGALCALVFDNQDIGRQTAQLTEQILSGTPMAELHNSEPEKIHLAINLRTADIIDVRIPKKIQEKAAIIYE